jgi:predicted transcriptional regulator of viral defense system
MTERRTEQSSRAPGFTAAVRVFQTQGPILRTGEVLGAGVHPRTLYALRNEGVVHQLSRGVYCLADAPPLGNPDLVVVAKKIPKGIVCLISALSFHHLTTQIPREVYLALPRGSEYPRLMHPPLRIFQFAEPALRAGVENHEVDGCQIQVYSAEKTLADCFKFRNRIGTDTAVEALRFYRERRKPKIGDLLRYAAICRVTHIMRPYLEALL